MQFRKRWSQRRSLRSFPSYSGLDPHAKILRPLPPLPLSPSRFLIVHRRSRDIVLIIYIQSFRLGLGFGPMTKINSGRSLSTCRGPRRPGKLHDRSNSIASLRDTYITWGVNWSEGSESLSIPQASKPGHIYTYTACGFGGKPRSFS